MTETDPMQQQLAQMLDAAHGDFSRCCDAWLDCPASAELLHDLRVAWRRTRAVLALAMREPALEAAVQRVKQAAAPVSQLSSPLRDLDVLAPQVAKWIDQEPALAPLATRIMQRRAACIEPLANVLRSGRTPLNKTLQALRRQLVAIVLEEPATFRKQALRRCERRVQRALKACADHHDAASWHQLRIRCKQWRYTLELFEMKPAHAKTLKRLQALQQCLGEAQDAATANDWLTQLALPAPQSALSLPPGCLCAIGRQQVALEQQRTAALARAQRKLKRMLDA